MAASADGTVAFAGWVGGSLFVSVDHADGIRTTYSWLSAVLVKKGDVVSAGQPVAYSGHGHPEVASPHLHFGARIGSTYIDPMSLLEPGTVVGLIHLAPMAAAPPGLPAGQGPGGPYNGPVWIESTRAQGCGEGGMRWVCGGRARSPP